MLSIDQDSQLKRCKSVYRTRQPTAVSARAIAVSTGIIYFSWYCSHRNPSSTATLHITRLVKNTNKQIGDTFVFTKHIVFVVLLIHVFVVVLSIVYKVWVKVVIDGKYKNLDK